MKPSGDAWGRRSPDVSSASEVRRWGRWALVLWAAFAAAEAAIRLLDLYRRFPPVDVPSHALSGAALAAALLWALARRGRPASLRWLAILGVALLAGLWETVELIDETITPDPAYLADRFLWDGFWDVVVTTVAGAVAVSLLARRGK